MGCFEGEVYIFSTFKTRSNGDPGLNLLAVYCLFVCSIGIQKRLALKQEFQLAAIYLLPGLAPWLLKVDAIHC